MAQLVLCTGNAGKISELKSLLPEGIELLGLTDLGLPTDLPETGSTFAANALQKARSVHGRTGLVCIADDSGLEVAVLNGAPGVYSARYAGRVKDDRANMMKLLGELEGVENRAACFRTVIALVGDGKELLFEGEVNGSITTEPRGIGGFGYDPVFRPAHSERTFAEMDMRSKNAISHRGQAVRKLVHFLTVEHPPSVGRT